MESVFPRVLFYISNSCAILTASLLNEKIFSFNNSNIVNTQKGVVGSVVVIIIAILAAIGIAYFFMNRTVDTTPKQEGVSGGGIENEENLSASAIDAVNSMYNPEVEEIIE